MRQLIYTNYIYNNFYYFDEEKNIIFDVEIKHIYLKKILYQIIENLKLKLNENSSLFESIKNKIKYYSDIINYLENNIINSNFKLYIKDLIKDNIFLNLKFNIKSNNFYTKDNKINMKWKICDYQI